MRRALLALVLLGAAACGSSGGDDGKTTVVAGFFALAEAVRGVAPGVQVVDLTPPGVEPHDLELTSKQVDQIEDADVIVVVAGGFQPGVERAAQRAGGKVVKIQPVGDDPHVWLDPVRMKDVAQQIAAAIPGANADGFVGRLTELDKAYSARLQTCERRVVVTGHEAFGQLANRYQLTQQALTGVSPGAEPDPKRLGELADLVRRTGTTTVFSEKLVSPEVSEALAREAGVKTDVLDPLESGRPGAYFDVMGANLEKLRAALGCR